MKIGHTDWSAGTLATLLVALGMACSSVAAPSQVTSEEQKRLAQAHAYLNQKKTELAMAEFSRVVEANPSNLDAQANLGVLLFFSGHPAEAEAHLKQALSLDPSQSKIQALLGTCEHRLGHLQQAQVDLTAALEKLPDDKVYEQTGLEAIEVSTALGNLTAAARIADELRTRFPTRPEVLFAVYRVYRQLTDEAIVQLSIVAPDSAQMHHAMAQELMRDQSTASAIANMKIALKKDPTLPGGHYDLGEMLSSSKAEHAQEEAKAEYEAALAQTPADVATLVRLGDINAKGGDEPAAIAYYRKAVAIEPQNADALVGLAYSLNEEGHSADALPLLQQAVKSDPTNILAHYRLSAVLRRLHRPEEARAEIATFERLKKEKDMLQDVYDTMRLPKGPPESVDAPSVPKP